MMGLATLLGLLWLALVCSSDGNVRLDATGKVHVEQLALSMSDYAEEYTVALFRVPLPVKVHVAHASNTTNKLFQHCAMGATRLVCGTARNVMMESFPVKRTLRDHGTQAPMFLYPLSGCERAIAHFTNASVYPLVSQLSSPLDHEPHLGFALLLDSVQLQGGDAQDTQALRSIPRKLLKSCTINFVNAEEQSLRHHVGVPPAVYRTTSGAVLEGSVSFEESTGPPRPCSDSNGTATDSLAVRTLDLAAKSAASRVDVVFGANHPTYGQTKGRVQGKTFEDGCRFHSQNPVFLSLEETTRMETMAGQPGGPILGLMKGVLKPIGETMAGGLSSPFTGALSFWIAEVCKSGLADDISLEIARALPQQIVEAVVPGVSITTPDQLQQALSRGLADYLTKTVGDKISATLNKHLVTHLQKTIPPLIDIETPKDVAEDVAEDLGQMLGRAVALSVVPALSHTLVHSPLQDYYCYYCHNHDTYCAYCQFSPSQVYWSEYYVSYFTTYYGSYYNEFFKNVAILEEEQLVEREKDIVAEDQQFEEEDEG